MRANFKHRFILFSLLILSSFSLIKAQEVVVEGVNVTPPSGMYKTDTMGFEDLTNGDVLMIIKLESEDITDKQHLIPEFLEMEIDGYEFIGVKKGNYNSKTLSLASHKGYGDNKNEIMIHTMLPINNVTYAIMSLILIDEENNEEITRERLRKATNNLVSVWDQLSNSSLLY